MSQHILVATDFSASARAALERACRLARLFGARVTLLHVFQPVPPALAESPNLVGVDIEQTIADRAEERLEGLAEELFEGANVAWQVVARPSAAEAICDQARARDADLVIVGTHGHTGLDALVIGSVAERVVRHAHCSVLVARESGPIQRIAVAVDLSQASSWGIAAGATLAKVCQAELGLLHVLAIHPLRVAERIHRDEIMRGVEDRLDTLRAHSLPDFPRVDCAILDAADPVKALCGHVATDGTDLLVVTAQGHNAVERFLIGSVSEKVVRKAPCSVLVVREG